jgi:hypothetical protein
MRTIAIGVACLIASGCASNGKDGRDGVSGEAGASDYVVESTYCTGFANINMAEQYITYEAEEYSDGSVFVSASVASASMQSSDSLMFGTTQKGWGTAPLSIVLDVVPPSDFGGWSVSLDRTTLTYTVSYADSDLPNIGSPNPVVMTFVGSKYCTVQSFSAP